MKQFCRILSLVCLSAVLLLTAACGGIPENSGTRVTAGVTLPSGTAAETGTVPAQSAPAVTIDGVQPAPVETEAPTAATVPEPATTAAAPDTTAAPATPSAAPETTAATTAKAPAMRRTGEMVFTYDASNKYMKAVIDKYGVDPQNLACTYTVPDNDGNLIFEFDGTTQNGKRVRTMDTLVAIYTIDKELNCKCASRDESKSEYPKNETEVMFFSVKYILKKYTAELSQ
ncbi:MAG: hypothetical protein II738_08100 [Clostridia bacterium]|nr:hypothetical protein [Clostridia bacterium]